MPKNTIKAYRYSLASLGLVLFASIAWIVMNSYRGQQNCIDIQHIKDSVQGTFQQSIADLKSLTPKELEVYKKVYGEQVESYLEPETGRILMLPNYQVQIRKGIDRLNNEIIRFHVDKCPFILVPSP